MKILNKIFFLLNTEKMNQQMVCSTSYKYMKIRYANGLLLSMKIRYENVLLLSMKIPYANGLLNFVQHMKIPYANGLLHVYEN